MSDEPKRRGRPPRSEPIVTTPAVEDSWSDEAVVENPPVHIAEPEPSSSSVSSTDTPIETVHGAGLLGSISDGSPIEQKIQQLVADAHAPEIPGWENNMHTAPTDGRRLMVSETGKDQGALVYWRVSKLVDKKNLRYIPKGRWTELLTRLDIAFVPKYWKPYNPEEYWPLTRV